MSLKAGGCYSTVYVKDCSMAFKVTNIDTKILFICLYGLLNSSTVEITKKINAQMLNRA
jgi:hypothetical protein